MRDLLKTLELKQADLLVWERLLRNSDTNHLRNAHRLQQVRDLIRRLQIQMDMINVLRSLERENWKKGVVTNATEQNESV